ncbi:hypothetical protein QOZ80_9BG0699220 [Eleusine coracana subsp. coracana]|nr:hypothetical protein QOZ80_9BG0699220 [Eleusine coracana subsp. coracana]
MSPDAEAAATTAATAGGGGGGDGDGQTSGASPSPSPAAAAAATAGRAAVRWDQILPRRSLRVLVEHDDSTRQVVTALLRKCGYRVAAVADGMKAWQVMRERAYAFDLVLTEVAMPTLSGIQLLARIVAADECKNIPVVMMSSQDSIGTVLKCMQKGAVDFLVKPVRKNELRNLWQHVWRRHAMNNQTNASENNAASNHISANAGNGSRTGENSDEESDTQSFGSKREPEIQSVEKLPENLTNERAGSSRKSKVQSECHGGVNTKGHVPKGTEDVPAGSACNTSKVQVFSVERNARSKGLNGITSTKVAEQIMDNALRIADASSHRASNLGKDMAMTQLTTDRKCKSAVLENNDIIQNTLGESSKHTEVAHAESCPSQFKGVNGYTNQGLREKDIFNHSNFSAFSRYGNKRIEPSAPQQLFPSLCITRQDRGYDKAPLVQPNEILPPRQHNTDESAMQIRIPLDSSTDGAAIMCSSSAREDAGTSSSSHRKDSMSHPSYGFIPLPIPVGATMPYHYSAILQPLYYTQAPLMHSDSAGINKATFQHSSGQLNSRENNSKASQIHELRQSEEDQQLHHSRQIVRESGEPLDLARVHVEHVNQSTSCSQDICKGSGCTGSAENDINTNMIVALESGNESGVQNCAYNGLDSDRYHREAALIKFRMKRKDRCFEKKVRYHSRKKLHGYPLVSPALSFVCN